MSLRSVRVSGFTHGCTYPTRLNFQLPTNPGDLPAIPWRDFRDLVAPSLTTTPVRTSPKLRFTAYPRLKVSNTAKMTRAQQTISIAMILTSVWPLFETWLFAQELIVWQIYLAVFMEIVSFPHKIQKEVVPVVRQPTSDQPPFTRSLPRSSRAATHYLSLTARPIDPILGSRLLRRIPSIQARLGRLHVQRCS